MSFAPTPPPTPPAPNSKPAPVPPDHVRIDQPGVILSAGIIVGKALYAPYRIVDLMRDFLGRQFNLCH